MTKVLCVIILVSGILSANAPLQHYGVAQVTSPSVTEALQERFQKTGEPLFLIHDVRRGLREGDFIRFANSIVLIDGSVWQTLLAEDVFSHLQSVAVTAIQGRKSSRDWRSRADNVSALRQRKAYFLGGEILKIFEEYFANSPAQDMISMTFTNNRMTLLVPNRLLDRLPKTTVSRVRQPHSLFWIDEETSATAFTQDTLSVEHWAVDPAEPCGNIQYRISGDLPEGLRVNSRGNGIQGYVEDSVRFEYSLRASNPNTGSRIHRTCTLAIRENSPPRWINSFDTLHVSTRHLEYPLHVMDMEFPSRAVNIDFQDIPPNLTLSAKKRSLVWSPPEDMRDTVYDVRMRVRDPRGAHTIYEFSLAASSEEVVPALTFQDLAPPWDTLAAGETYRWDLRYHHQYWRQNGVEVTLDSSSSSTQLDEYELNVIPGDTGLHHIRFRYVHSENDTGYYDVSVPVVPNSPPVFTSFPEVWNIDQQETYCYSPRAFDHEGGAVEIRVDTMDSEFVWNDSTLCLTPQRPGSFYARFAAEDHLGHTSRQSVQMSVNEIRERRRGHRLERSFLPAATQGGDIAIWTYRHTLPNSFHFGVFTPDDCNLLTSRYSYYPHIHVAEEDTVFTGDTTQERNRINVPFLFIGREFLSAEKAARGSSLSGDLGISYNYINSSYSTFGLYAALRLQKSASADILPGIFTGELSFWGRHLIQRLPFNYSQSTGEISLDTEQDMLETMELLRELVSPSNINLSVSARYGIHAGYGFLVGPALYMRIAPFYLEIDQYIVRDENDHIDREQSLTARVHRDSPVYILAPGLYGAYTFRHGGFDMGQELSVTYGGERSGFLFSFRTYIDFGYYTWEE
jgi:hypothetical protein